MNTLARVRNLELTVKFYELDKCVFEIFQKEASAKKITQKNRCISRGPFEFNSLILLIQNDIIKLGENELVCVLDQLEESINEYLKGE